VDQAILRKRPPESTGSIAARPPAQAGGLARKASQPQDVGEKRRRKPPPVRPAIKSPADKNNAHSTPHRSKAPHPTGRPSVTQDRTRPTETTRSVRALLRPPRGQAHVLGRKPPTGRHQRANAIARAIVPGHAAPSPRSAGIIFGVGLGPITDQDGCGHDGPASRAIACRSPS